jgi:hypothetical protein
MLGIKRALDKALKIRRVPRAADFRCIHLLEAEDVSFNSVELRAEHRRTIFEGSPFLVRVAEAFEIEGANPHQAVPRNG